MKKLNKKDYLVFLLAIGIVLYAIWYNQQIQTQNQAYFPRPLTDDDIQKYSNTDPNAVVIYPIFSQFAYGHGGFYDYYTGICGNCTTVLMKPLEINATYVTSYNGLSYLMQLHYPFITDIMVDKHPEILKEYNKIILLHNEYMTKTEFDAIKNHKNVIYLYPNSMYAEVKVDYNTSLMTLVKGHGYPTKNFTNGFSYITSSKNEFDLNCKNYKWIEMPNGMEITCWPEFLIKADRSILQTIKDFPQKTPNLISAPNNEINVSNMGYCNEYGYCAPKIQS